jgi:murein L,D-transpeptidase YcbB/YkuD
MRIFCKKYKISLLVNILKTINQNKYMKLNKLGAGIVLVTILTGSSFAMEVMATGTMMKKDDTMMKGDTMMKKDLMSARQTEISDLQNLLIEKGYLVIPAGVAKGTFGPKTRAALIKFQKANGLNASGYFGPLTKAKMMKKDDTLMKGDTMMKKDDAMMMKATDTMIKTN